MPSAAFQQRLAMFSQSSGPVATAMPTSALKPHSIPSGPTVHSVQSKYGSAFSSSSSVASTQPATSVVSDVGASSVPAPVSGGRTVLSVKERINLYTANMQRASAVHISGDKREEVKAFIRKDESELDIRGSSASLSRVAPQQSEPTPEPVPEPAVIAPVLQPKPIEPVLEKPQVEEKVVFQQTAFIAPAPSVPTPVTDPEPVVAAEPAKNVASGQLNVEPVAPVASGIKDRIESLRRGSIKEVPEKPEKLWDDAVEPSRVESNAPPLASVTNSAFANVDELKPAADLHEETYSKPAFEPDTPVLVQKRDPDPEPEPVPISARISAWKSASNASLERSARGSTVSLERLDKTPNDELSIKPFAVNLKPSTIISAPVSARPASTASPPTHNNKCNLCSKTVYLMEQVSLDGKFFHKTCLKCEHCKSTLKMGNLASLEGKYYCKPHFKQLFKLKGNYSEGFGKEDPKKVWAQQHAVES